MSDQLTEHDLMQYYQEALRLCEADAGGNRAARILRLSHHYKSTQAYVSVGENNGGPTHVIKSDTGGSWDPEREFTGLDFLVQAFSSNPAVGQYRLGAIMPVGYGLARPFLVTRYQPGQSMRPVFDKAIRGLYSGPMMQNALDYCQAIASWHTTFRSAESRTGAGLSPEEYLKFCQERSNEISQILNANRHANIAMSCLQRHIENLSDEDRALMGQAFPTHGDLAPQNFLVDEERIIYALDLESFDFKPMDMDLTYFCIRLQEYACRGPFARRFAQDIWTAYWDAFTSQNSPTFTLLSLIYGLLAHLAWVRNPDHLAMKGHIDFRSRLRTTLWIRTALRWIEGLKGDLKLDLEHARSSL